MKLHIQPTLIFRTPKFSYQTELTDCWEELKEAISISSAAFYETIKDVKANELAGLPPKIHFTIWKYFNRSKFRATPYGTFASFSLLENAIKPVAEPIVVQKALQVHELVDWPQKNNIGFQLAEILPKNCMLFSNSSYYLTPNSIRYIACADGVFELAELDYEDTVKQILDSCLAPISVNDLVKALQLEHTELEGLFGLLQDMHDLQLIFTDYDPNIIGTDYFERIGFNDTADLPKYLLAQRTVQSGNLEERLLQAIPALAKLIQDILPAKDQGALGQFTTRFKKKFEDQEIPLLVALDPEMGVGYDELEQAGQNDDFIARLNNKPSKKTTDSEQVKNQLRTNLTPQGFEKGKTIFLNKLSFTPNEKPLPLPNSLSMIMSVQDDLIFAEQIGGASSNALTGRFTMTDEAVERYTKSIARIEQEANPDVLFFDVAYMVETTIDNVNRRKLIYNHQLSILNFDTSATPLVLNDIQLSVRGTEVILRSKSLNKRLIPRMASAYNYSRSDLSVFRLLCDLQHQGLQSNLSLPLDSIFPDLDYYPRLQYQNIVLSNNKWKIKKENLLGADKKYLPVDLCREYLSNLGLSPYFKAGVADQTLCFALDSDEDLNAFLQYMQKQNSIYLEEVTFPQQSTVVDEQGKPYLSQFILSLTHNQQLYAGITAHTGSTAVTRFFPPGKEWLYFEIYSHQQRSDQVLAEVIAPFVVNHEADIKTWFFIRYNENGNHIRFRLQLHNELRGQALIADLMEDLAVLLNSGLVSDVQIKTYKRELERYGSDNIENVEKHFAVDSAFVLSLFETQPSHFDKYKLCAALVSTLVVSKITDRPTLFKMISGISDAFNREHHLDAADFKQLNSQYQEFRKAPFGGLNEDQQQNFNALSASLIGMLKQSQPTQQAKLFSDLMHMHVNRLFNKDQRTHEMVMYYFLVKEIQRQNAMAR